VLNHLFIDDERYPPADNNSWLICRDLEQVEITLQVYGFPQFISFDHDLGQDQPTGYDIVKWLIEQDQDPESVLEFPLGFNFYVHSQNPIGVANIQHLLDNYLKFKKENIS